MFRDCLSGLPHARPCRETAPARAAQEKATDSACSFEFWRAQADTAGTALSLVSWKRGDEHEHWFRAQFFQQYRLLFRFHAQAKVIVFAWVNDEDTKRAYGSADYACRVFRRMLDSGHPPSAWDQLLAEAGAESERLARLASGGTRASP